MNLTMAQEGKEYIIQRIETDDEELNAFLFSLGCYSGEPITVVARRRKSYTVSVKMEDIALIINLLKQLLFNRDIRGGRTTAAFLSGCG